MYNLLLQRKAIFITVLFSLVFSISIVAQEKWEFSNSTPRETVKSHLYFLEKGHYDPVLSSYTLTGKFGEKKKIRLAKRLKSILLKHKINTDDVLDKRRGIVKKDEYILFLDIPKIYLVRKNRRWLYSKETVNSVDSIFNAYVLKINPNNGFKQDLKKAFTRVAKRSSASEELNDSITSPQLNLSTPYHTIVSHLLFLEDSINKPNLAAKTINFGFDDSLKGVDLAVKLKQIYLGSSHEIFNINKLSQDSNFIDTLSGKHIYYPNKEYPELFLEKVGEDWLYSNSTSKLIKSVHAEMYSEDAEQIFRFSDKFKRWAGSERNIVFYNIKLWQLLMLLYFILLGIILLIVNRFLIKHLFFIFSNKYRRLVYKTFHVLAFIIFYKVVELYLPALEMDINIMHIIHKVVRILIVINITVLGFYIVNILKLRLTREDIPISQQGLLVFIILIVKVIIFISSLLFIIKALDFDLLNVLAGLSIGGLALALGAQDTIKNFFGSVMIFTDKPFSVGDYIVNDNIRGQVEEVGLRTTKIRTPLNSVATIPNGKLADNNIDNLGRREYRRFKSKFTVSYDTSVEKLDRLTQMAIERIESLESTREEQTRVYMNDFGVYGIEIFISISFNVNSRKEELENRQLAIKEIINICKELDVKFAIPLYHEPTNRNN